MDGEHRLLLDESDAADYLNVPKGTITTLRRTRGLPFLRVSGRVRFRTADLDAFVERNIEAANDELINNAKRLLDEYVELGGKQVVKDPQVLVRIGACIPASDEHERSA